MAWASKLHEWEGDGGCMDCEIGVQRDVVQQSCPVPHLKREILIGLYFIVLENTTWNYLRTFSTWDTDVVTKMKDVSALHKTFREF